MWGELLENCRMALGEHWPTNTLVHVAVGVGGILIFWMLSGRKKKTIEMGDGWWCAGERPPAQSEDPSIRTFIIQASEAEIQDLHERLDRTRYFSPLEDSKFHYGFNSTHLKETVSYWRNRFDWRKQVEVLNKYPHYKTKIEGLDIHFIHVKPILAPGQKARPLLIVHGWPGSIYEFYPIIPLLTEPAKHGLNPDLIFEVICPSIPGYGFSEASHKKGFNSVAAARIFYKLMSRLGFNEFYLQGGDWGSLITTTLAQMKPESVKGLHLNIVFLQKQGLGMVLSVMVGRYLPWLVGMTREDVRLMYPYFEKTIYPMLRESGYMHIQATKPDTVGSALNDSPGGLAAYILEKFSSWTEMDFRDLEDGGLERKYSMDNLLTNVMIYWVTGSITSSMRFYKENFTRDFQETPTATTGVYVPTGIAAFPCDVIHTPRVWAKGKYKNIVTYTYMPRGGHFAAFEEPELLARDIHNFVCKVEKM
ncbi:epoxide hydrolase 1-like [Rhinophrynus dorsalis]